MMSIRLNCCYTLEIARCFCFYLLVQFLFFVLFCCFLKDIFKPFLASVSILYPRKTENQSFSTVFRGYEMGALASND